MRPRLRLRCQLHENSRQHVLKSSSRCRLGFSTSAAPKSTDTSEDSSADINAASSADTNASSSADINSSSADVNPSSADVNPSSADINASSSGPYAKDERQTWRMRADGERKLPLPPILDPIAISRRERWTEPKKPVAAPADRTPFQKKLYNCAFAHMLITPIREDRKLGVSLPSHFLVPFRPLKHPSTDNVWLLPGHGLKPTKAAGSFNAWAVARREHLRALGTARRSQWRRLTGSDQAETLIQGSAQRSPSVTWRADMDELVLQMLRENVVKQLRYGFSKPRGRGVVTRLWDNPAIGFVPYYGEEEDSWLPVEDDEEEVEARSSVAEQLSLHAAPAALLFLRPLTPLSAQPFDALAQHMAACDALVDRLVNYKTTILRKFHPDFTPGPHSVWAHTEHLQPRLAPRIRVGKLRPSVVRWTPQASGSPSAESNPPQPSTPGEADVAADRDGERDGERAHSRLIPVYSLPDLLGGDDAVSALLGGEQGERLWGRDAVLLKAGPGAIGALLALERLRTYVDVPW